MLPPWTTLCPAAQNPANHVGTEYTRPVFCVQMQNPKNKKKISKRKVKSLDESALQSFKRKQVFSSPITQAGNFPHIA